MTQIPRNTPEQGEINKLKEQAIATKPILNGNGNSTDPLRNPELMKIMRALNPVIEAFRLAMTSAAKPEVIQASSVMNSLGELQRQIESLLASCLALTETPPASKDESHTQTSGAA